MLASPPCFFIFVVGLTLPVLLSMAAFLRLPIRGFLPKGRAMHSPRYVVIPGLFLSCATEEAPRLPSAGTRKMPLLAASPAAPAAVWPSAFRRNVAKAKAAEALVHLFFPANFAEDPPNLDVDPLEKLQRPCLLQKHIRLPVSSVGCLTQRHS